MGWFNYIFFGLIFYTFVSKIHKILFSKLGKQKRRKNGRIDGQLSALKMKKGSILAKYIGKMIFIIKTKSGLSTSLPLFDFLRKRNSVRDQSKKWKPENKIFRSVGLMYIYIYILLLWSWNWQVSRRNKINDLRGYSSLELHILGVF